MFEIISFSVARFFSFTHCSALLNTFLCQAHAMTNIGRIGMHRKHQIKMHAITKTFISCHDERIVGILYCIEQGWIKRSVDSRANSVIN